MEIEEMRCSKGISGVRSLDWWRLYELRYYKKSIFFLAGSFPCVCSNFILRSKVPATSTPLFHLCSYWGDPDSELEGGEVLNTVGDLRVKNQKPEFSKHVLSSDWVSGMSHTTVKEAEKTLLLPCSPPSSFHRCHSCQNWYACSHGEFCCEKTGIVLQKGLPLLLLVCYFGKRIKAMFKCIIKRINIKTVFKCIINHTLL